MQPLSLFIVPVGCWTKRSRDKPVHMTVMLTPYCSVLISHYIGTLLMHSEPVSENLLYFYHLTLLFSARECY
jgi:hypothetical protein